MFLYPKSVFETGTSTLVQYMILLEYVNSSKLFTKFAVKTIICWYNIKGMWYLLHTKESQGKKYFNIADSVDSKSPP